jgi:hypothetical protein
MKTATTETMKRTRIPNNVLRDTPQKQISSSQSYLHNKKMKQQKSKFLAIGILSLATSAANAALVITPTGAIASSEYSAGYDAGNLIDDSALSGTAPHTILDTHTGNAPNTGWLSSGAALPQTVTFDLGSSYLLTAMHIWQYGHPSANYSKNITVQFSTTGTGGVFGGDVDIILAIGAATVSAQTFAIPSITANAVKFTITSGTSGNYVGLSEVKFSAIPEPGSALLGGLGLLMLLRRRRN